MKVLIRCVCIAALCLGMGCPGMVPDVRDQPSQSPQMGPDPLTSQWPADITNPALVFVVDKSSGNALAYRAYGVDAKTGLVVFMVQGTGIADGVQRVELANQTRLVPIPIGILAGQSNVPQPLPNPPGGQDLTIALQVAWKNYLAQVPPSPTPK
jgi:hypothetical protein